MAYQYVARVRSSATYEFDGSALEMRPRHAQLIMKLISFWSHVDIMLVESVIPLLGAEGPIAITLMSEVISNDARSAMINAILTRHCPENQKKVYEITMKLISSRRKVRNDFAHFIWGHSNELPEHILLANPYDYMNGRVRDVQAFYYGVKDIDDIRPTLDPEKIRAYRESDISDELYKLGEIFQLLESIKFLNNEVQLMLSRKTKDQLLTEIKALPVFQESVARKGKILPENIISNDVY